MTAGRCSGSYDVAPGAAAKLKVKLARGSRRLASGKGRLKAVAVASAAGTTAQSSQRLALALGSATARRG